MQKDYSRKEWEDNPKRKIWLFGQLNPQYDYGYKQLQNNRDVVIHDPIKGQLRKISANNIDCLELYNIFWRAGYASEQDEIRQFTVQEV